MKLGADESEFFGPPSFLAPQPATQQSSGSSIDWGKLLETGLKTAGQIYVAKEQAEIAAQQPKFPTLPGTDFYGGSQGSFTYQYPYNYSGAYVRTAPTQDNTLLWVALGGAAFIAVLLMLSSGSGK